MAQFRVSAFSEPVRQALIHHGRDGSSLWANKVAGLLEHLSLFHIEGLDTARPLQGVFAIAHNIISRGAPTLASPETEKLLADILGYTALDSEKEGVIQYGWKEGLHQDDIRNGIVNALHLVLPKSKSEGLRLSNAGLESSFEKAFLKDYIPEKHAYLRQLFARQRPRKTLGATAGNEGRADFCLEVPYLKWRTVRRFGKDHAIRYKEQHVVEVDGTKYHKQAIDDLKDFAIAGEGTHVHHIRESAAFANTQMFLDNITSNNYIQKLEALYSETIRPEAAHYIHALLPTAVARMQMSLLQWLHTVPAETQELKIAVIEQDIPAATQALEELKSLLYTLDELAEQPTRIPSIELTVFTNDWLGQAIPQPGVKRISEFKNDGYDAVFDLAMLQRPDVFQSPVKAGNLVLIRSVHYEEPGLQDGIIDAAPVLFKNLGVNQPDGSFQPREAIVEGLRKLLSLLFRKTDFRQGQLPILGRALRRKSVIGLLPTGGGKSLTYQLAALLQPGITIVVDPIRSLMLDQHRGLNDIGVTRSIFINSVLSAAEKREAQKELATGKAQLVFISPERLVIQDFRDTLTQAQHAGFHFAYCVIDEVHCLSEWGHDFRTPYLHLGVNAREFCQTRDGRELPLFGLTATASFDVLADIERELEIDKEDGHAVVRYENTVRNEIFFSIQETNAALEKDKSYSSQDLKKHIAATKRVLLEAALDNQVSSLEQYQDAEILRAQVLPNAFDNYIPDFERMQGLNAYVADSTTRLLKDTGTPLQQNPEGNHNYGGIVFAPHRKGSYGVHDLFLNVCASGEKKGYFMGAGGDDERQDGDAENHQEASIAYMDAFISGKTSLMFATKAFGMGIDKPDVRWTYHLNIPGSIESFMQEAGRAARDGKVALATVYFNRQRLSRQGDKDAYRLDESGEFLPDREILDFFYRIAFQGPIKETVILDELLTRIQPPRMSRLRLLAKRFAALHFLEEWRAGQWSKDGVNKIYLKINGEDAGYLSVTPQGLVPSYVPDDSKTIVSQFRDYLHHNITAPDATAFWRALSTIVEGEEASEGIETLLADHKKIRLTIPFRNKYYPVNDKVTQEQILSPELQKRLNDCQLFKKLATDGIYSSESIDLRVEKSLKNRHSFHEFVSGFVNENHPGLQERIFRDREVQEVYSLPRNEQDTAKAIYRLTILGIVDSYTIDYQNSCFEIFCRKKPTNYHFEELERLISRYSSAKDAAELVGSYKKDHKGTRQSEMRFCLERLTEFVYAKIAEKRKLAANDMVRLCEYALDIQEPVAQSEAIKAEIYYYFNAKYARPENEAVLKDGKKQAACLLKRLEYETEAVVEEFVILLDEDTTGSFKNNLKHLRGASQRSINAYPDFAAACFLRAYCLIIQSEETTTQLLVENALEDLSRGLHLLQARMTADQITAFLRSLQQKIKTKVTQVDVDEIFRTLEDEICLKYHFNWLEQFATSFLNT